MTMPEASLSRVLLLPELKILKHQGLDQIFCEKVSRFEVCYRCATPCSSVYDHRWVKIKDTPIRGQFIPKLNILKRRFWCNVCRKPFTEPVSGVLPGRRTTQRFRSAVLEACKRYRNLSQVCKDFQISSDFAYKVFYERLELKRRMNNQYPWPRCIGLDEHGAGKSKITHQTQFVTMVVNQSRGSLMEVVMGKSVSELVQGLEHIPGRQNVRFITMDMCEAYRSFSKQFFPQAHIVVDKFHVIRLLSGAILKERRAIAGTNASKKARRHLLCSAKNLDYWQRMAIQNYLEQYPRLRDMYQCKEDLHTLYRIKNPRTAAAHLDTMIITSQLSETHEVRVLGRTLLKWKTEILNYFHSRLTNARVESFNNTASLIRRCAYGYRNKNNYRLRLLNACS